MGAAILGSLDEGSYCFGSLLGAPIFGKLPFLKRVWRTFQAGPSTLQLSMDHGRNI